MKDYSNSLVFIFLHKINYFLFQKCRFFGSRKLGRTLSKLLLPKHYTHSIISTIYNFKIILPPKNNFEIEELYYLGFYEAGTLHVIKKILKQDDVFIDIGASVGLMSLYAAKLVGPKGKIWAFEPMQEMVLLIKKSAELNGYNNIDIFECALGDKETILPIYTNRACPSLIEKNNEIPTHHVTVKILDKIIEEQKLENIKMIKIDVEGFEL
ncbi:MAG: FkbM family methyltransferase, partial [Bacteroidia bacterium]|nr:FkbM family methyltransferase [Bacteroidia bacterium]